MPHFVVSERVMPGVSDCSGSPGLENQMSLSHVVRLPASPDVHVTQITALYFNDSPKDIANAALVFVTRDPHAAKKHPDLAQEITKLLVNAVKLEFPELQ